MSLTARDLLHKIANDADSSYKDLAIRVNQIMSKGVSLRDSVKTITKELGLNPNDYVLDPVGIVREAKGILQEDFTQTLTISAVLGQMMEGKGKDRLPAPAFFSFLEILSTIPERPEDVKSETSEDLEEQTTRMIELMTTLVSVICEWSHEGLIGVAGDCPEELREMAKSVYRKVKMLESGLWTCISCGKIVNVQETWALICEQCDKKISGLPTNYREPIDGGRDRVGYGQTSDNKSRK